MDCRTRSGNTLKLIFIFIFLSFWGWAQTGQLGEQEKPASAGTRATQEHPAQEQKISPQEADKLFRSVDEILQFASKDTLFPIRHEVKRQLVSRDEVETYVNKHTTEDEDAGAEEIWAAAA